MSLTIHAQNLHITLANASNDSVASPQLSIIQSDAKADRFTKTAGGDAVIDSSTGLMWSSDTIGSDSMNWEAAKKAAGDVRIGGHADWRLPTIQELLTLVDYERYDPAINTDYFKAKSSYYWTSTPYKSSSACAWIVFFGYGDSNAYHQLNEAFVRAVRRAVPAGQ